MGGDTLVPTVSVYQMNLFPSRYNVSFADRRVSMVSASFF